MQLCDTCADPSTGVLFCCLQTVSLASSYYGCANQLPPRGTQGVPGPRREAAISPSISILPALAACYLGVYETLAFCKPEILWQDTASQVLISLAGNKSLGYLYLHYQLHLQSSARTSWRAAASNPPCFLSFCASPAWAGQAFAGGEIRQAAQGEMWIKTTSPCWGRRNHTWPWSQSGQGNMLDFGWHRDVKSL